MQSVKMFLLLLCLAAFPHYLTAQTSGDDLPFVPIADIGESGRSFAPSQTVLTAQTEKTLQAHLKALKFPVYIFSGGRDRTHFAYMSLPADLKAAVFKVWIVAPAKHSTVVKGFIRLAPIVPGSVDVRWSVHTALAYRSEEGMKVFDAAIAPGKILDGSVWFAALKPDHLSFWTMTDGRLYAFNEIATPGVTRQLWNGDAMEYSGKPATEGWIASSLARDAVGEAILKDRACEVMRTDAKDAAGLLEKLQKGTVPAGCEDLLDLFKKSRASWSTGIK